MIRTTCALALGAMLMCCVTVTADAHLFGVHGPKGNDTGGIIPWSPEYERAALDIAQQNCGRFGKFAVIRSVRRVYGDYIAYDCQWDPPRRSYVERSRRPVHITIDK
jgi:hypothetical protein